MGVHISDDKSVVSTAHKTFHFDLSKDVYNDLKHEICSEAQKSVLNLSYRLHLKSSNKHVALQNLSIHYLWKKWTQQYKNNKLKIIAPTWKDEFELLNGCYSDSDMQDYIKYIMKNTKNFRLVLLVIFT